jgi:hypothetical protein
MPMVRRIFRYPNGREKQDGFDSRGESYGIGETLERDRICWKGIEGRSLFGEAGFDSEIVFVRDVPE